IAEAVLGLDVALQLRQAAVNGGPVRLCHALVAFNERHEGHALVRAAREVPSRTVLVRGGLSGHELFALRRAAFEQRMEVGLAHLAAKPETVGALAVPLALPLLGVVLVVVPAAVLALV